MFMVMDQWGVTHHGLKDTTKATLRKALYLTPFEKLEPIYQDRDEKTYRVGWYVASRGYWFTYYRVEPFEEEV